MTNLIYNHKERSMWNRFNSGQRGLLGYYKEEKTFSCEDSDLECAGVNKGVDDLGNSFMLEIDENKHIKYFNYERVVKDAEGEVMYWEWRSVDGFRFVVFND
jgi:hypothetical protein